MNTPLTTTDRLAHVARILKVAPTTTAIVLIARTIDKSMSDSSVVQFSEMSHGKAAVNLTAMSLVSAVENHHKLNELHAVLESLENVT